jgi:hypothetical protein
MASIVFHLRVCPVITSPLWRERRAGRGEAPRRRRCGVIVEERQTASARPAPRPSGCGPQARWPCCSLLTSNPVCSSLAPCQRAWSPAAKWACSYVTGPNVQTDSYIRIGQIPESGLVKSDIGIFRTSYCEHRLIALPLSRQSNNAYIILYACIMHLYFTFPAMPY